ncbi:MAG TPA: TonB family protein [Gemmatimonadaceae bacterium]|nr:TonB family protein [Gemmatimonadaceae bacterium]
MRLLESKPEKKTRWAGGTIFSIILHVGLIFLAVFATARAGVEKAKKDRAEKVNFVAVKEPPPPPEVKKEPPPPKTEAPKPKAPKAKVVQAPRLPKNVPLAPPKGFQVVPPVVNIPTALPSIDLSKVVTNEADFSGKGIAGGTAGGVAGGTGKAGDKGKAAGIKHDAPYMEFQVEKPVRHIGGATPEYPSSLKDMGVKGEVLAQFVVGENGRYQGGTLKILSSSNPAFSDAVKRALPGMRFSAAQIGGQKVKQLVQQAFQFQLKS